MKGNMKTKNKMYVVVVALLVMITTIAASTPTLGFIIESVNIETFPLIEVRLSAWDSSGRAMEDLKPANIQIVEEGGSPFQPDSVKVDTDSPLAVALVMDVSGSMKGQALTDAQVAAARFLDHLSKDDQVALIAFSSDVDVDPALLKANKEYPFTDKLKVIYDAIEGLNAEGGTELYNALQKAIALTAKLPEGHRAVLLLSDGMNDPADVGDPEIPLQMAKEMNVPVFVIGLGNNYDKEYLDKLAAQSGGLVRIAPSSSELAQTFDHIAELLKTQFVLTYESGLTSAAEKVVTEFTLSLSGSSAKKSVEIEGLAEKINDLNAQLNAEVPMEELTEEPTEVPVEEAVVSQPSSPQPYAIEEALVDEESTLFSSPWLWIGAVALLAVLGFFLAKRKPKPKVFKCASCGYTLAEGVSRCPECGETRKMQVK